MIYTSEMARKALQIEPVGTPYEGPPCTCAMCQRPITTGVLVQPRKLPQSFTDYIHVASSNYICADCAVTRKQVVMRALQRSVITEKGIYNINSDAARAWFWLTPPEPPFTVIVNHNDTATFHYYWRTPVTLDKELIQLNVDNVLHQVRRSRILQALAYVKLLIERAPLLDKKKSEMKSPFIFLIRDPNKSAASNSGILNNDAQTLASLYPDCKEAVAFLQNLTPGELIALSPLVKRKPEIPTKPELMTKLDLTKKSKKTNE